MQNLTQNLPKRVEALIAPKGQQLTNIVHGFVHIFWFMQHNVKTLLNRFMITCK